MDWVRAIERNREALGAVIAALFVLLDGAADRVPRAFHRAVCRVLFPTESAVRRLIVIASRGLVVAPLPARPSPKSPIPPGQSKRLAFRLFDRRKHLPELSLQPRPRPGPAPRIHVFGGDPRIALFQPGRQPIPIPAAVAAPAPADGLMDGRRLRLRLEAAARALAHLPRQAQRLARLRARRSADERLGHLRNLPPLRPGPPPGHRKKQVHDIDFVLAECHGLAWDALRADTS